MANPNELINNLGMAHPVKWAEFIGVSGHTHAFQFSHESTQASMVIDVPWEDFESGDAIFNILGASLRSDKVFVSEVDNQQHAVLHRTPPARHPIFDWLWATSINNVEGVKFIGKVVPKNALTGPWSQYEFARLTVSFTTLPFDIISDEFLYADPFKGDESYRWTVKNFRPGVETLAVEGGFYTFAEGIQVAGGPKGVQLPLGTSLMIPKHDLEWTWLNVPADILFARRDFEGGFIYDNLAINVIACIGKVNSKAIWGFEEETLLCLPPEFVPTVQPVDPALIIKGFNNINQNNIFPSPRSWNVKFLFRYISANPPGPPEEKQHGHNAALWAGDMKWYLIQTGGIDPAKNHRFLYDAIDLREAFLARI